MDKKRKRNSRKKYLDQRWNATIKRNIKWNLCFETWMKWWEATGHWHERGCKTGQYCMARFNDIGPYELGNIKCILQSENSSEAQTGKKMSTKGKPWSEARRNAQNKRYE